MKIPPSTLILLQGKGILWNRFSRY